ncbi:MAG: homoserine kinase [Saprospiraceae bacterium]|nr:homoserine kinase [Saprospiraceae bacterium]MBK8282209.1 homoserine kinase [Saprospiraceae bacterium]
MGIEKKKAFAPATVSNICVGFDVMGFAMEAPGDEVIASVTTTPGVQILSTNHAKIPMDAKLNTASVAVQAMLDKLGDHQIGIGLEVIKKMPVGTGMGSSAASAAAALVAANALLGDPFRKPDLLEFAVKGEKAADGAVHADNVAPSLLGGFVLIRSLEPSDVIQLPIPSDLYVALLFPHITILTKEARGILSPYVDMKKFIQQTANMGAVVAALYRQDWELLRRSLIDVVIEPQRAKLIPFLSEVKKAAYDAGAITCSISGAGPAIFSLAQGIAQIQKIQDAIEVVMHDIKVPFDMHISKINQKGSVLMEGK